MEARLKTKHEQLLEEYQYNLQDVLDLQSTVIRSILPAVVDELQLDSDAKMWAEDWLSDLPTIFRIARRNKFTRSFALESIRKNLIWRLENLWPVVPPTIMPNVHCLPEHIRDPFGRPIIIVETITAKKNSVEFKSLVIQFFDRLREHLRYLSEVAGPENPLLQSIVLLDLKGLSLQSLNIDFMTWTIREVIPRFPGMLAGVLVLNYSWAHSGMWSVVKRLLPESALSRVFFPTQEELIHYLTSSVLPKDYGGTSTLLCDLQDPLQPKRTSSTLDQPVTDNKTDTSNSSAAVLPSITSIAPTSLLNPFFGYPASTSTDGPSVYHSRRRKRDLARTLIFLFWNRWKVHLTIGFLLTICILVIRLFSRKGFLIIARRVFASRTPFRLK